MAAATGRTLPGGGCTGAHALKRRAAAWLLAVAWLAAGCPGRPAAELEEVPHPDLSAAESAVREQVAVQRETVDELLAAEPADAAAAAAALAELGRVYLLYDFPQAAEACFTNAARLAPDEADWQYLLAYITTLQGRPEEGRALYRRALELRPGFQPALLRLGRVELELGQYDAARGRFEAALAADPEAAAAHEGLGKLAAAAGDPAAAAVHFERALELAPRADSLRYALGQTYRDLGRTEEARRELAASGDVAVPIVDPLISPLGTLAESAQFYLVQGGEALEDGDYERAVAAYGAALERDAASFVAIKGLAYALEKLGDLDGAVATLERGLAEADSGEAERGERAEILRVLGGLEALRGRDAAAAERFAASLALDADQPDARMKLANSLSRLGRFGEALPLYDRMLEEKPEHAADILLRRATALVNLGRGDEALADFRRAVELRPDDRPLRLRYADALAHLGRAAEAARQRRLAGGGGDAEVLLRTARQQRDAGRYQQALDGFTAVLDQAPERHDVRFERAQLLGHLGRYAGAVADFRRVIEAEPRHAAARHGETTALILLERYGEARVRLNEALRIFSLDARLAHLQARLLATVPEAPVRDGRLALEVARRLLEVDDGVRVRETFALALAESGRTAEAAELQRRLVSDAESRGDRELAADLRAKLETLDSGRAWWASGPQEILDATLPDDR